MRKAKTKRVGWWHQKNVGVFRVMNWREDIPVDAVGPFDSWGAAVVDWEDMHRQLYPVPWLTVERSRNATYQIVLDWVKKQEQA